MFHVKQDPENGLCRVSLTSNPESIPLRKDWTKREVTMTPKFETGVDRVYNLKVREDDVWVVTLPKCGTTWMQELSWLLVHDFDFAGAKATDLTKRSPFMESCTIMPGPDTILACENLESPRVIKSHLPAPLLPKELWEKKPKVIYVARNPKDMAVSYYHMFSALYLIKNTKEEFLKDFLKDNIWYGAFWDHIVEFWQMRNEPNIFFTTYEAMKKDIGSVIKDLCKFLNKPITEDQLQQVIDHVSFESMRNNPACNYEKEMKDLMMAHGNEINDFRFMRQGVVGSHKKELSEEVIKQFDEWSERSLKKYNMKISDIF